METLIEHLRHPDATLSREKWATVMEHLEVVLREFAVRLEAVEAKAPEPAPVSVTPDTPAPAANQPTS